MKSKVIILDIDGTVVDSPTQKLPNERLIQALRAIEGDYYVSAATGRVWSFAAPVLGAMELEDLCIISGGTQIVNPKTGEEVWRCAIEPEDLALALEVLRKHSDYKVLFNDYDEDEYLLKGGIDVQDVAVGEEVYFLEQIFVPNSEAPETIAELSKIEGLAISPATAQRPGFTDIHITSREATKEHAISELLQRLGVDAADSIGVGDGLNDIHLFKAVGHKVAMGNSVDELKNAADVVIGSVTDDGLAEYLEKLAKL